MILYHAFTTFHLIEFMVHKVKYKHSEEAMIVYPEVLYDKYPQIESEIIKPFFAESHQIYTSHRDGVPSVTNLKTFEDLISNINEFDEIYIAGAQNAFAFWLIEAGIRFFYVEEAAGRLSRPEVIMKNDISIDQNRFSIANKLGMYTGENDLIINVICDVDSQVPGYKNEKMINFKLSDEILQLPDDEKNLLLRFFCISKTQNNKGVFFLTQHFANLKMLTYEEQMRIYQSSIGFCFPEETNIVFKLHPDDVANYKRIFPRAEIVDSKYPSELLLITVSNPGDWTVATISSTGINSLKRFGEVVSWGTNYEKEYTYNSVYYLIFSMLEKQEYKYIFVDKEKQNQIANLFVIKKSDVNFLDKLADVNHSSLCIFDKNEYDATLNDIHNILLKNSIIIFLDSNKLLYEVLSDDELNKKVVSKTIRYKEINSYYVTTIFLLIEDAERRKQVLDKELVYEDEKYDISIYTGRTSDDMNNIQILEGQLRAANKVISKLKSENVDLKNALENKVKGSGDVK